MERKDYFLRAYKMVHESMQNKSWWHRSETGLHCNNWKGWWNVVFSPICFNKILLDFWIFFSQDSSIQDVLLHSHFNEILLSYKEHTSSSFPVTVPIQVFHIIVCLSQLKLNKSKKGTAQRMAIENILEGRIHRAAIYYADFLYSHILDSTLKGIG